MQQCYNPTDPKNPTNSEPEWKHKRENHRHQEIQQKRLHSNRHHRHPFDTTLHVGDIVVFQGVDPQNLKQAIPTAT
jgi:hypothetical protein